MEVRDIPQEIDVHEQIQVAFGNPNGGLDENRAARLEKSAHQTDEEFEPILSDPEHSGINTMPIANTPRKSLSRFEKYAPPEAFDEFYDYYIERYIPALLIVPEIPCHKIIIYFHANAEDIGQTETFCRNLNSKLEVVSSDRVLLLAG